MVTAFPGEPTPPESSGDGTSTPANREPTPIDAARRTRLDREVDEILQSATRDKPLPPTPIASRRAHRPTGPAPGERLQALASSVLEVLMAVPLITAVGFGIACAVVAPHSPLAATLFAVLALVVLVVPYIRAARRASGPGGDGPKMWRGQVMDGPPRRPSGIGERTPADKVNDWINSRRS